MAGPERIVVIGGTGFIGSVLVQLLAEQGHDVTVVSRQRRPLPPTVLFSRGDIADRARIMDVIDGATAVFHLGTGGGVTWADFDRDFVQGTCHVAEACLRAGVRRVIYTSSTAALYAGGRSPITELTPTDPQPQKRSLYARGKIAAEAELIRFHKERQLPVVIVRPAVVVGSGGLVEHGGVGQWPSDLHCIGWGRGTTRLPFVLVRDVAEALVCALTAPSIEGRAFNLVGDVLLSAREYVELLARESLRNYCFHPRSLTFLQSVEIIKWMLKVAARKGENPFPSYRDLKSRSLCALFDTSAAKEALGWRPNGDLDVFLQEAIHSNRKAIIPSDLRHVPIEH